MQVLRPGISPIGDPWNSTDTHKLHTLELLRCNWVDYYRLRIDPNIQLVRPNIIEKTSQELQIVVEEWTTDECHRRALRHEWADPAPQIRIVTPGCQEDPLARPHSFRSLQPRHISSNRAKHLTYAGDPGWHESLKIVERRSNAARTVAAISTVGPKLVRDFIVQTETGKRQIVTTNE